MAVAVQLSPVTRIEGHLAVHTQAVPVSDSQGRRSHRIERAECRGEMFRGFEVLLEGRDPLDAQQIVQRICGVCFISHAVASIKAQEMAYGIKPSPNGRLLQNLILAANLLQSHLVHFYQLALWDYVDVRKVLDYSGQDGRLAALKKRVAESLARSKNGPVHLAGPFLPQWEGRYLADVELSHGLLAHYADGLEMRRLAHEMGAVFGARMPHSTALVPGGCTQPPLEERIAAYRSRLERIERFAERVLLDDVVALCQAFPQYWEIGAGYGHLLCYGSFELNDAGERFLGPGVLLAGKWHPFDPAAIAEQVGFSRYSSPSGLHPASGQTTADPRKVGAYSWIKAPRYKGLPMEVGPLARILVNYHAPRPWPGKNELDKLLGRLGVRPERLVSVLGRLACRALEAVLVAKECRQWLDRLQPSGAPASDFQPVKHASAWGLVEAPRGALGHWLTIEDGKIRRYQCVVPTAWNCSPRDDAGQPGPMEKALEGLEVADPEQPIELGRVVRSFDPCMACAVH